MEQALTDFMITMLPNAATYKRIRSIFLAPLIIAGVGAASIGCSFVTLYMYGLQSGTTVLTNSALVLVCMFVLFGLQKDKASVVMCGLLYIASVLLPKDLISLTWLDVYTFGIFAYVVIGMLIFGIAMHLLYRNSPDFWDVVMDVKTEHRKQLCIVTPPGKNR